MTDDAQRVRGENGLYLKDDVPFSCCDPSVIRPCVHQAMRDRTRHAMYPVGNSTLYKVGCSVTVHLHTVWVGSWLLYGLSALASLTIVLLVICRYLQTSISEALRAGNVLLPSRGYLWSFGRRNVPGTRAPPPTPATQPSSPRRPTGGDKNAKTDSKRGRRGNMNKSNRQANNSAALFELAENLLSDDASQWSVNTDLELIADQLAPSSLSDRTLPTSGETSDGDVTPELLPPTVMLPANDSGTASQQISAIHASDSPNSYFPSSSPIPNLWDNWNSNANIDFNSMHSFREARSAAPLLIFPVELDHSKDDVAVTQGQVRSSSPAGWQTQKYREQSKSRRRLASKSDQHSVANTQRLARVKTAERSYITSEKSAESRKRRRTGGEDISIDRSSARVFSPVERVKPSDQMTTHRTNDHRRVEKKRNIHSTSVSESYSTCESVSSPLGHLSKTSRRKTLQHALPTAEPHCLTCRQVDCVCPMTKSLGSVENCSPEGRSSEWSTISCQTFGSGSLSKSKRSTSSRRKVPDDSTAAFLALNNYLLAYKGDTLMSTESHHESTKWRSKKRSKVVQKSSLSTTRLALSDKRMSETRKPTSTSKTGRSSNSSWSTVSYQTLSRLPSPTAQDEIVVEEERSCFSTHLTTSEQLRQTNNSCNSDALGRRSSAGVLSAQEMRRRSSKNFQHVDSDRITSPVTSPPTPRHASCNSRSMTVTRSVSTRHVSQRKHKNSYSTSTHPSPLVQAAIRAAQLRVDVSALNTASEHFWCDSITPPRRHSGLALSYPDDAATVKTRRRSADYETIRSRTARKHHRELYTASLV